MSSEIIIDLNMNVDDSKTKTANIGRTTNGVIYMIYI